MAARDLAVAWAGRRLGRRRLLKGLAGAGVLAGGAACSATPAAQTALPPTAPPAPTTAAAPPTAVGPSPKRGGALQTMITIFEPNLEPHTTALASTGGQGPLICYSQLLTYKWGKDIKAPSYIVIGDLAESWTQPDDLTYLFKLRPGVKFHNIAPVNGREVVADDVVYSYQRIRDLKVYATLLGSAKFEAADKSTVKLTLEKPDPDLLTSLASYQMVVVARERVEQTGDLNDLPVIGTGPWILDTFMPRQRFIAKRNPDYFNKGVPYLDTYDSIRTADTAQVTSALRAKAVNIAQISAQNVEDMRKAIPNATLFWSPQDRVPNQLVLNQTEEMFTDIRVRQAISKAIDRKAIIDTVWLGHARLYTSFSVPDASWNLPEAELERLLARDVEGARRLLREAGRENLRFEMLVPTYLDGAFVQMGELVQANLKEIGVTATLNAVDGPTLTQRSLSGNFQATCAATGGNNINAWLYGRYYTGGGVNTAKYSNPALDKLIDQQATIVRDVEARKKIFYDIQRMIINDAVYMTLHLWELPVIGHPELKEWYPPIGFTLHSLYWSTAWLDK
jgi:peptide/nickel transport system substrate-binding protein